MLKVTLKGLAANKTRFVSTLIAVFLGVAFLVGVLVLSDTVSKTFDDLFADANRGVDAYVRSGNVVKGEFGPDTRGRIDESLVEQIKAVDGVQSVAASVGGEYAQIVGTDGKYIGSRGQGAPTFGGTWLGDTPLNPWTLLEGKAPAAGEVVVDKASAKKGKIHVGDTITVLTVGQPEQFKVAGIARFGSQDNQGGATWALFDLATAEKVLAEPGKVDAIKVAAKDGVSEDEVTARVRSAVATPVTAGQAPPANAVEVLTGAEITKEDQDSVGFVTFFKIFFGVFAGIAVIVSAFVIYNTFSIIVAQRTREMALLRAVGASRRQVLGSIVGEALVVGAVATAIGIVGGIGVGALLKTIVGGATELPAAGLVVSSGTILAGTLVGMIVTVGSAVLPAVRASRVPPIAALRDVAVDTSATSKRRAVIGAILTVGGIGLVLNGVFGSGDVNGIGLGALATLIGTVVSGPVFARPISWALGAPAPKVKGVTGVLARQNAMRNPQRTAGTASALLIGVGVVALIAGIAGSLKASIDDQISRSFVGDITVNSGQFGFGGFSPQLAKDVGALPEVANVAPVSYVSVEVEGDGQNVFVTDTSQAAKLIDLGIEQGTLEELGAKSIAVLDTRMKDKHWKLGDSVKVRFAETGESAFTIGAVFSRNDLTNGDYVLSEEAYDANVANPIDQLVFVKFKSGVDFEQGRTAVEAAVKPYSTAEVQDRKQLKDTFTSQVNFFLTFVFTLLGVSIIIAVIGIANTLKLSVHERTRELGLLRAVGMTRRQVRSAVRWESAIISLFGTIGGLALGLFFSWAIVVSSSDTQDLKFRPQVSLFVVILVLGALVGVWAARKPAKRAARLDILDAIATE
jgi:putative ABC transport system permease protein